MPGPKRSLGAGVVAAAFILLAGGFFELYQVAQNSGRFLGSLSLKWAGALLASAVLAGALLFALRAIFAPSATFRAALKSLVSWRNNIGSIRWVLAAGFVLFPAYFVFFSPWGWLFRGIFIRALVFLASLIAAGFLVASGKQGFSVKTLLVVGLLIGVGLVLGESLVLVSDYPFALHWSEGNRLWDYSVLFGRFRYNYPADQPIFVWIDPGRQALWGLPFALPQLSIFTARLWGALLTTIPYALLGWFAFKLPKRDRTQWLLAGLWALVFLNQGPIYTPLVLSAILVAFARRKPIWLALPLVILAGIYAGTSRFTWSFAPAIWAVMLTVSDAVLVQGVIKDRDWLHALVLGLGGLWSKGMPILVGVVSSLLGAVQPGAPVDAAPGAQGVTSLEGLQATATSQPYTWYRLLPNEAFAPGILLGLALAVLPLIWLLVYLRRRGFWKAAPWQRLILIGGCLAFLVVGIIASAKVGGGGDLHNLDMLLVTLVLIAGVAWEAGLQKRLAKLLVNDAKITGLLAAMFLVPALFSLFTGKPLRLPEPERTEFVLERIQDKVACAANYGPVLFMDQRQLLTFGLVENVPLVPDYEKKFVMDQALADNEAYFAEFYEDLAAGEFALIVSEREGTTFKELDQESIGDSLIEENNAWTRWVSIPLLSYYESVANYRDAAIELFMPIGRNFDCP